ncbi:hypothetical protein AWV63_24840 [Micromonospora rifamycinica]|nr:hypothetical protein AWV63_24840 [Micromonospora rifamycinica]
MESVGAEDEISGIELVSSLPLAVGVVPEGVVLGGGEECSADLQVDQFVGVNPYMLYPPRALDAGLWVRSEHFVTGPHLVQALGAAVGHQDIGVAAETLTAATTDGRPTSPASDRPCGAEAAHSSGDQIIRGQGSCQRIDIRVVEFFDPLLTTPGPAHLVADVHREAPLVLSLQNIIGGELPAEPFTALLVPTAGEFF